jgi:DNA-binding NtrC family response regulator
LTTANKSRKKTHGPVEIKLDLPPDIFDDNLSEQDFRGRVRELAILELVRIKRLHEHEAQRMLGVERWELVERMERAGITPTEKVFDQLKHELGDAIAARRSGASPAGGKRS